MLKVRLIPILLLKDGRLIKTKQFDTFRDVGNPKTVARVYEAQNADELIFLDITATNEKRNFLLDIISSVAEECFIPITVGGGIRTLEQAKDILKHGADKIAINTMAIERPDFINELVDKFGSSTIVVSIDYKKNKLGEDEVYIMRGQKGTGIHPLKLAGEVEKRGAGEVLLTSIEREGTMSGLDIDMIKTISDNISIPLIASGGVGTVQDLVDSVQKGNASAVSTASMLHFTDQTIFKCHIFMKQAGLPVRV
ncbi:MAG: imidazole glycerol phosphate synthase cyclase subunit [bacterium]|nr:imidazole glycerol phosphate synthase cyclase subunit [bacterium]